MESVPQTLDERQRQILGDLVRIPSPSGEEQAILEYIQQRLDQVPGCRITRQRVDDCHWNLIVEKGQPDGYTILLYGHVDTVRRKDGWENRYELTPDRNRPGVLRGVGCSDMKSGVMMIVDLFEGVVLPPGVRLIGAFCGDEERTSKGAQKLLEWDGWSGVDLILSPEIATRKQESDHPKDIVVGRRGNVKTAVSIHTPGGHGYDDSMPSAIAASRELRNHMMAEFHRTRRRHPYFGWEQFDETFEDSPKGDFLDRPTDASFGMRHMLVPGRDIADSVQWQMEVARRLAVEKKWAQQRITYTLAPQSEVTSYPPYLTDTNCEAVQQIVVPAARTAFGGMEFVGGLSPADSNLLARTGRPVVEVGPVGGEAHRGTEWVGEASVACTAFFYRHLLLEQLPQFLRDRDS